MNTQLTDAQLIARVKKHCAAEAHLLANVLVDLLDIEDRRLHLKAACSSMYDYCRRHFGMSPNVAWRRTAAARLVRRVPGLLDYVRRGEVDLSTLVLLRNFITPENAEELIRVTKCRSKRDIQKILEQRAARPDVGARLRSPSTATHEDDAALLDRLDEIDGELHRLEVTIAAKTRVLIERARDLLSDRLPNATVGDLVHRAFETLVETLEDALATAARRRKPKEEPGSKGTEIPRALRRAVFARDGYRCTFVSADGHRCRAMRFLHVDHIIPRARGGRDVLDNLRCVCSAHNQLYAEQAFGKAYIQSRIRTRRMHALTKPRSRALG